MALHQEQLRKILALLTSLESMQKEPQFNELNTLYNYQLEADRTPTLREEMKQYLTLLSLPCEAGLATDLYIRCNNFFDRYKAKLGVDIRDSLFRLEKEKPLLYFKDTTPRDATTYRTGEDVHFRMELREKHSDLLYPCHTFTYRCEIDGLGLLLEGSADGASGVFELTVPADEIARSHTVQHNLGTLIKLDVTALSEDGPLLLEGAAHKGYRGGAVVDFEKLSPAVPCPADFCEFWEGQLARMMAICPTDTEKPTETTRYAANGPHPDITLCYDVDLTNYFQIEKFTPALQAEYRRLGLASMSDEDFADYDIYELSLKAPGPCPSTGVLAIPKRMNGKADARFHFDGYSVHSAGAYTLENEICYHVTHHGYENRTAEHPYYSSLNGEGILGSYGRQDGRPNSTYENKDDCYLLYMLLRNAQALRFFEECVRADPDEVESPILADLCRNLQAAFSGRRILYGGSMGGYQVIGVSALACLMGVEKVESFASAPAFCGLAAHHVLGRLNNIFGIGYTPNMDYFDPVFFAELIDTPFHIEAHGLGDYTCPPSGAITVYNMLRGTKDITLHQNAQHGYTATRRKNGAIEYLCPYYRRAVTK